MAKALVDWSKKHNASILCSIMEDRIKSLFGDFTCPNDVSTYNTHVCGNKTLVMAITDQKKPVNILKIDRQKEDTDPSQITVQLGSGDPEQLQLYRKYYSRIDRANKNIRFLDDKHRNCTSNMRILEFYVITSIHNTWKFAVKQYKYNGSIIQFGQFLCKALL